MEIDVAELQRRDRWTREHGSSVQALAIGTFGVVAMGGLIGTVVVFPLPLLFGQFGWDDPTPAGWASTALVAGMVLALGLTTILELRRKAVEIEVLRREVGELRQKLG